MAGPLLYILKTRTDILYYTYYYFYFILFFLPTNGNIPY